MSSALINRISWLAGTPCSRASRGKRFETFATAGPRSWVVISMSATGADIASRYSTRVVIATVPSARLPLAPSGSPTGRRSCCPFLTSTSPSHFHSRSVAWHFRTRDRSIPSCFRPLRKLCSPLPAIPAIWAPPSASLPCCTPGVRTCIFIRTCIASCPVAASPPMAAAGSLYPQSGHLQPPPSIDGKRPRPLRLERLRRPLPHQDHDPRCGRVHPSLPCPRVASRLGPHPPLRLPRQPGPQRKTAPVPHPARRLPGTYSQRFRTQHYRRRRPSSLSHL